MSESFNLGDIVWTTRGSFPGVPSWPSAVTKDKETGEFHRQIGRKHFFHVSLLENNLSSWICISNIIQYHLNDSGPYGNKEVVQGSTKYEFDRAIAQANHIFQRKAVKRLERTGEQVSRMPRIISQRHVHVSRHTPPHEFDGDELSADFQGEGTDDEVPMLSDDENNNGNGESSDSDEDEEAIGQDSSDTDLRENGDGEPGKNNVLCSAMEFDPEDFSQLGHSLCNYNTVIDLVLKIERHPKTCSGKVIPARKYVLPKGHIGYTVFLLRFQCYTCDYIIEFCPSPIVKETGRPIGDYLALHSKITSSGLSEDIERFTETLGFSTDFQESFESEDFDLNLYGDIVCEMAGSSMREARLEVIVEDDQLDGTFDATHLIRKNSPCSSVSMLSPNTWKILYAVTVNRTDDPISQNHEPVGIREICQQCKNDGYRLRACSFDGGSSGPGIGREEFPETFLGNRDPFHGLKNDSSKVKKCTTGTKQELKDEKWHHELADKHGPLMTHMRYAITRSRISVEEYRDPIRRAEAADVLRSRILNPVEHYQDRHGNCSNESRCNVDPGYDLSREKIYDSKAVELLEQTLSSTDIFQNADKYLLNLPTSMNESYHNRQQKYFSKRTYLSPRMYSVAIGLSILDHNENEEGVFSNGERVEPLPLNKDGLQKQPIQTRTFVYKLWKEYMLRRGF